MTTPTEQPVFGSLRAIGKFGRSAAGLTAAAVAVLSLVGLHADGGTQKGKPPTATYTVVTASFEAPTGAGYLTGDGTAYIGDLTSSAPTGAFFMTSSLATNYFALLLNAGGGRHLYADFTQPFGPPGCATATGRKAVPCRKPADWTPQIDATWGPNGFHVVPRDSSGAPIAGGMLALAVDSFSSASGLMNFPALDKNGQLMIWRLTLDVDQMEVTRTGDNAWTIQTLPGATAHLEASPDGSATGRSDEGYYYVSFTIRVVTQ